MEASGQRANKDYCRFQLFQGDPSPEGGLSQSRNVGMAYLKYNQDMYTLRLWTFLDCKFYMIRHKEDTYRYMILTRELNRNPNARSKYHWNLVGSGFYCDELSSITLHFDLIEKPIFMNLYPAVKETQKMDPLDQSLMAA